MKRVTNYMIIALLSVATFYPSPTLSAVSREQEVRNAVSAFVAKRTSGMGWDIRIRRMTISDPLTFPEAGVEYEIVAPQQWEGWGNAGIAVLVRQNDRVIRNIPVKVDVEASMNMVVTLHEVERGDVISAGDVVLQKREISQGSQHAVRTVEDAIGKMARATMRANQPLREDQLEKVPLVKSGQLVTIILENEAMKISVSGKARSSGAEGDTIRVQNLTSLKEIPARVISASTVQVAF